jgi:hypothetical protein
MNGRGNTEARSVVMTFYFFNVNVTAVCIITAGNNLGSRERNDPHVLQMPV